MTHRPPKIHCLATSGSHIGNEAQHAANLNTNGAVSPLYRRVEDIAVGEWNICITCDNADIMLYSMFDIFIICIWISIA